MFIFTLHTEITNLDTFAEFALSEAINERDMILTNESIFIPFIRDLELPCEVLFQEKYGSGEPNDEMIDSIRKDTPNDITRIVAVGGGTVIDIAKILVFAGEWKTEDLFTGEIIPQKVRSLIVVPTTCGTGSEVTNITISALRRQKTKKGLALDSMYADRAILITEVVKSLPYKFFATSSMDAFIHAMESYLSPKAIYHSEAYSEKAMRLILQSYLYTLEKGLEKWKDRAKEFLLASNLAGIAFGYAGCAAIHATSYPLSGKYHIPHGEANQLMLSAVLYKYKQKQPEGKLKLLEELVASELNVSVEIAITTLLELFDQIYAKKGLREYGIAEPELEEFADSVIVGQQRLLSNNYVEMTRNDILEIYRESF